MITEIDEKTTLAMVAEILSHKTATWLQQAKVDIENSIVSRNQNLATGYRYYSFTFSLDIDPLYKLVLDALGEASPLAKPPAVLPPVEEFKCDCGAEKTRTTHATWCTLNT